MKVLLFINKLKDSVGAWKEKLVELFNKYNVNVTEIFDDDLSKSLKADALFVFGGDGTILKLVSFANRNEIPIVGINAGNVGFLTEFEVEDLETAIKLFVNGGLKLESRLTMEVEYNGQKYVALNDVVVQRTFEINSRASVTNLTIDIDNKFIDRTVGDGVAISTPTGSTAYSMSAGGAILAPGINALSMTPISSRSLHNRPIIFSADQSCKVEFIGGSETGLFIDGMFVAILNESDKVNINKNKTSTLFFRKNDSDFYDKLILKLDRKKV